MREELRLKIEAEGVRHGMAGVVNVLIGALLLGMISLFARLAERLAQQQACRDGAGAEPGSPEGSAAPGGDVGADRGRDADAADAGHRVAGRAAVAAEAGTLVCEDATHEDCIQDEGGVRAECGRPPGRRWHLVANLAAMGMCVSGLESGFRVLDVPFAKMGLRARVKLCRFRYGMTTLAECGRFLAFVS